MKKVLELGGSRIGALDIVGEDVVVSFSHAFLRPDRGRDASVWTQEAEVLLERAHVEGEPERVPSTVAEGYLESGGVRHESLPLPFRRIGPATFQLWLENGALITVRGDAPMVELVGNAVFLENAEQEE